MKNPVNMTTPYADDNIVSTFTHVIGRTLNAYTDSNLGPQDLVLGASSNVMIEGVDGVSLYTADDSSGVKVYATTYDQATDTRTDKLVLQVQQNAASNTTIIAATESNAMSLQPSDLYRTVDVGDMSLSTSNATQRISTTAAGGFVFDKSVRAEDNLVAANQVYGKGIIGYTTTGLSNVGNISEAGFCMRMNNQLQIEIIKYGKVVLADQSTKKVYKRVGVFGTAAITEDMESDVGAGYDPFGDLSNLLNIV